MKKGQIILVTTFAVLTSIQLYTVYNTTRGQRAGKGKAIFPVERPLFTHQNPLHFEWNVNSSGSNDRSTSDVFSYDEGNKRKNGNLTELSGNWTNNVLSRKKRYILFPDGSTFTAAVCATQTVLGAVTGTAEYTESFVWALVYDLPSTLQEFGLARKRRDVHRTMAQLLNRANIEGEDCVLKSVCEVQDTLRPKLGVAEEVLRLLFTIPEEEEEKEEKEQDREMEEEEGEDIEGSLTSRTLEQIAGSQDCDVRYPACPVSLLHMLLRLQVESVVLRR